MPHRANPGPRHICPARRRPRRLALLAPRPFPLAPVALAPFALAALVLAPPAARLAAQEPQPAPPEAPRSILPELFDEPAARDPGGPQAPVPIIPESAGLPPPPRPAAPLPPIPAPAPVELADPLAGMGGPKGQPEAAGLLGPATAGYAADLFRGSDARFLAALAAGIEAPLASRWAQIMLQRALLSVTEAPPGLDPADWLAARAQALVAIGSAADAHRMLMRIALDRYTPRLVAVAGQAALAAGDPAGLCPVATVARGLVDLPVWRLAEGMCAGITGDDVGAALRLEPLRARRAIHPFDLGLAERIAATVGGARRAANPEWTEVEGLTAWRIGLASAAGIAIPDEEVAAAPAAMRAWLVRLPGQPLARRAALAPAAAAMGAISGAELARILAAEAATLDPAAAAESPGRLLAAAHAGAGAAERLEAMRALWSRGAEGSPERYGWRIATATAAARIAPSATLAADAPAIVESLLSVGLVPQARRWWPALAEAERDLGAAVHVPLLAVDPALPVDEALVRRWAERAGAHRAALVRAGLEGLGRLPAGSGPPALDNPWTRAFERAVAGRRLGEAMLLAATALQGSWANVPPDHLRRIARGLAALGARTEAGLIVAEAAARG